ncbi:MAG: hypothetical protein IAE82_06420 [Opitutaceae bacterium]|nr:hypothetical protein [Opitutaceae bacterium]
MKWFLSPEAMDRLSKPILAANVDLVRTDFQWRAVEKTKGTYDFSGQDAMVAFTERKGIALLGLISHTPDWAAPITDHLDEWLAFVETTVKRYPQVRYWEVFNEPDLRFFWGSKADPAGFARLLRLTYDKIKAIDPTLYVISGGISGGGNRFDAGFTPQFAEPLLAAGIAGAFDAFGIHPYRQPHAPEESLYEPNTNNPRKRTLEEVIGAYRALLDKHGCADKPIWITECGYPAVPGSDGDHKGTDPNMGVGDEDQARFLPRCILLAFQYGASNWMWFTTQTAEKDPMDREHWFGILHPDGSPRPAYHALKTLRRAYPPGSSLLADQHTKDPIYRLAWKRPDGRTVWALWITDRTGEKTTTLSIKGKVLEAFDALGHPVRLRVNKGVVPAALSGRILYIVGPDAVEVRDAAVPKSSS